MNTKPIQIAAWRDIEFKIHDSYEKAEKSNAVILELRELNRKKRILQSHIDITFDDWLKYTERDKANNMRQGAESLIHYFIKNDMLKDDIFKQENS